MSNGRENYAASQDPFFDEGPTNLSLEKPTVTSEGLDHFQDTLSMSRFVPGFGAIPDVANSIISLTRGNFLDAGMNLAAAIPGFGDAIQGAKLGAKTFSKVPNTRNVFSRGRRVLTREGVDNTLDQWNETVQGYNSDSPDSTSLDLTDSNAEFKNIEDMPEFNDIFGNIQSGITYKNVPDVGTYQYNPDGTSVLLGNADPSHPLYNEENLQLIKDVNAYTPDKTVPEGEFDAFMYNTDVAGVKG